MIKLLSLVETQITNELMVSDHAQNNFKNRILPEYPIIIDIDRYKHKNIKNAHQLNRPTFLSPSESDEFLTPYPKIIGKYRFTDSEINEMGRLWDLINSKNFKSNTKVAFLLYDFNLETKIRNRKLDQIKLFDESMIKLYNSQILSGDFDVFIGGYNLNVSKYYRSENDTNDTAEAMYMIIEGNNTVNFLFNRKIEMYNNNKYPGQTVVIDLLKLNRYLEPTETPFSINDLKPTTIKTTPSKNDNSPTEPSDLDKPVVDTPPEEINPVVDTPKDSTDTPAKKKRKRIPYIP